MDKSIATHDRGCGHTAGPRRPRGRRTFGLTPPRYFGCGVRLMIGFVVIHAAGCSRSDGGRVPATASSNREPAANDSDLCRERLREHRAAVAADPSSITARASLAMFLHANDQRDEAAALYETLRTDEPAEGRWPYFLARLRQDEGDSERARELLDEAAARAPDYALIELRRADLLFKVGDHASAEAGYRSYLARAPASAHGLIGLARIALQRRTWRAAESHLLEAIRAEPTLATSFTLLAAAYEAMGESRKAADVRARATTARRFREPDDLWLESLMEACCDVEKLSVLADVAIEAGRVAHGVTLLRRAQSLAPARARTRLALGKALLLAGERTPALVELREAVRLEPTLAEAHFALVAELMASGDPLAALTAAAEGVGHLPQNSGLHRQRGTLLQSLRRPAEAEAALRQAAALDSGEVQNVEALGNFLWAQGREAEAVTAFEQARALSRLAVKPRAILAGYYLEAGRMLEAETCLREAAEIDPAMEGLDALRALFYLRTGNAFFRAGNLAGAETAYLNALDAKPDHEESWTGLVALWQRTGRMPEARARLEQLIRDFPQAVFAYALAARVALQAGDRGTGLGFIERGLAAARAQSDRRQEEALRGLRARLP